MKPTTVALILLIQILNGYTPLHRNKQDRITYEHIENLQSSDFNSFVMSCEKMRCIALEGGFDGASIANLYLARHINDQGEVNNDNKDLMEKLLLVYFYIHHDNSPECPWNFVNPEDVSLKLISKMVHDAQSTHSRITQPSRTPIRTKLTNENLIIDPFSQ